MVVLGNNDDQSPWIRMIALMTSSNDGQRINQWEVNNVSKCMMVDDGQSLAVPAMMVASEMVTCIPLLSTIDAETKDDIINTIDNDSE